MKTTFRYDSLFPLFPQGYQQGGRLPFKHGVSGVVMNRLEILALDPKPFDPFDITQFLRHRPNDILDEHRVVIGLLGDRLFILPLEQRENRR